MALKESLKKHVVRLTRERIQELPRGTKLPEDKYTALYSELLAQSNAALNEAIAHAESVPADQPQTETEAEEEGREGADRRAAERQATLRRAEELEVCGDFSVEALLEHHRRRVDAAEASAVEDGLLPVCVALRSLCLPRSRDFDDCTLRALSLSLSLSSRVCHQV